MRKFLNKNKKENIIELILIVAAFLSLISENIYLRYIGLSILVINFFTYKRNIKGTFVLVTIGMLGIVIGLLTNKESEKSLKEFTKIGYRENERITVMEDLNKLAQNIDNYILQKGHLPDSIKIMQKNSMVKDVSYNLVEGSFVNPYFYYEKLDSNYYYVSGIGRDGIGGTEDDIRPSRGKYFRIKIIPNLSDTIKK